MLRNYVALAAAAAFSFAPLSATAQGLPPEDFGFEIETEETVEEKGFLENLSQYFGATLGANSGTSNAVDKTISAVAVQVDVPEVLGLKSAFNFDLGAYENTYKLELSDTRRNTLSTCQQSVPNPDPENPESMSEEDLRNFYENECYNVFDEETGEYLTPELERVVDDSFTELTEAYVQWEPTSFATIRLGRQPIVLGQFEVFSPLMFTTPMKATGTKTKTTKADLAYAQDGLQVSLFPLSQLEVSVTAIPKMRMDPANEKRFEEFALLKGDFTNFMPGQDQVETFQDIEESDMTVARVMYFGDRFTLGLTSITGAETNEDPIREARLVSLGCEDFFANNTPPDGSDCAGGFETVQIPGSGGETFQRPREGVANQGAFDTYALGQDKGLRFAEIDAIALELSVRLTSKLSFVFEQTIVDGEQELSIQPFGGRSGEKPRIRRDGFVIDPMAEGYDPEAGTVDLLPFFNDVYANNGAKPYINVETTMSSAGFVYKGDRWLVNAQIAQRIQKGASAQEEEWRKALDYDTYYGEDTEENGSGASDILPIVNVARLLGAEKQGFAGFGFGTFGQNFGFGLSAGWRFFEKLEIGAFGGMALDVTGADEIEAEGYDSPEGEGYASVGINYLF